MFQNNGGQPLFLCKHPNIGFWADWSILHQITRSLFVRAHKNILNLSVYLEYFIPPRDSPIFASKAVLSLCGYKTLKQVGFCDPIKEGGRSGVTGIVIYFYWNLRVWFLMLYQLYQPFPFCLHNETQFHYLFDLSEVRGYLTQIDLSRGLLSAASPWLIRIRGFEQRGHFLILIWGILIIPGTCGLFQMRCNFLYMQNKNLLILQDLKNLIQFDAPRPLTPQLMRI